jgi:ketosteroid isomerase-like protein
VAEVDVETRIGIVRTTFELVERGEVDAGLEYVTDDIEFLPLSAVGVEGRAYRGHDGLREWQREREETWDLHFHIDEIEMIGDNALVLGHIGARGRGSGVELDTDVAWVLGFRGDKICRVEAFTDRTEGRAAAGRPAT